MTKRLIPAQPYIPIGGVNWDQLGLNLATGQVADILNMRIFSDRLETRSGCRRIATVAPSGDPILHMARYKKPNGAEVLFGFTKGWVYIYNETSYKWDSAYDSTMVNDCSSTTGWSVTTGFTLSIDTTIYYTTPNSLCIHSSVFTGSSATATYTLSAAADWTGTEYIYFRIYVDFPAYAPGYVTGDKYTLKFSLLNSSAVSLKDLTYDFALVRDTWAEIVIPLTGCTLTDVKSFVVTYAPSAVSGPPINIRLHAYIDDIVRGGLFHDITHWSTTEFTDDDLGMTIVAAGSQIPLPNDAETDGGARVLLYYDKDLGYFKKLYQRIQDISIIDEELSTAGGTTFSGTLAHYPIAEGVLEITDGTQNVADSNRDGTLVSTVSGDTVSAGTIDYLTGAYSVTFKTSVTAPTAVTATYDYYANVTSLPRYICNFHNRLCGFNVWDGVNYTPWRIIWSDVGNMNIWNTDNLIDSLDADISGYHAVVPMGQYLVLYKEFSVELLLYTGSSSPFATQTVLHEGIFAGRTVTAWANKHLFLGKDNVYMFDGSTLTPLATDRVRKRIFDVLNMDGINTCFGYFYEYFNEYWLWITRADEDYPTAVFVYSVFLNAWSYFEFDNTTCMGDYHLTAATTIDELVGTVDEQNWKLNSGSLEGALSSPMIASEDGDVYALDERMCSDYGYTDSTGTWTAGSAIPIRLVTRDFIYNTLHQKDRTQLIYFEARGDEINVSWSHDFGRSFNDVQTITLGPDYDRSSYYPDVSHQYLRFKFEATDLDQYFSLRWVQTFSVTEEKP